jgi:hypothetical protein
MKWMSLLLGLSLCIAVNADIKSSAQEPPRGSVTIDRIAEVKYPTEPDWLPDGKSVAFLWDAAGKQDLFMAVPGNAPVALAKFPVDPDILTSNIAHFQWLSPTTPMFPYGRRSKSSIPWRSSGFHLTWRFTQERFTSSAGPLFCAMPGGAPMHSSMRT